MPKHDNKIPSRTSPKEAREAAFVRILTPIQANAVTVLCGHRE